MSDLQQYNQLIY